MKKNSTLLTVVLCIIFTLLGNTSKAQFNLFQLNFNSIPDVLSGVLNGLNSKCKFYNVRLGMDAEVTVKSASSNASIDIFDDNTVTKPEAFSPKIKVPAGQSGYVEFEIKFVHSITGTAFEMDSLFVTAIDIDGNATLKEFDVLNLGSGSTAIHASATPEITVEKHGNEYKGTNIGGIEYDGVDSTAKNVMFTVKNKNVRSFIYRAGVNNTSGSEASRQKSIYFKNFSYVNQTILPVKYASFDAAVTDKSVVLKWVTSMETNNDHFEVERSFTSDFSTIGLVLDAESLVNGNRTYRFKDNAAALQGKTVVYYRLKQVDANGKFTYSNTLAVRLQPINSDVAIQVAPNPFAEKLYVRFTAAENGTADIRINSIAGQTVVSKQSIISKGYNNLQVDGLTKLAPGMYVAIVMMNGAVIGSQKVIRN